MRDDIPISKVYSWALPKLVKKRAKAFKQVLEHEEMRKVSILYEKMWGERYLVDLGTYCFESRLRSNYRSFSMRGESQVDTNLVKLACQQPTCALLVQTHTSSSANPHVCFKSRSKQRVSGTARKISLWKTISVPEFLSDLIMLESNYGRLRLAWMYYSYYKCHYKY